MPGFDPDQAILRLAQWSTALRPSPDDTWPQGRAEKLPLPDGQAPVAWTISSAPHWEHRGAAISEARRVLTPDGRLVLAGPGPPAYRRRIPAGTAAHP